MADYDFPMSDAEIIAEAQRCKKLVEDTESIQRKHEREDLQFQLPENQWTDAAKAERMGGTIGGIQTPARPMVSISLLRQPMQLVYNQFTRARLGVNLHPVSEDADEELAEIKQGLYRRIERDGGAQQARGWAFMRALTCGRGWYRINKKYDEDAHPNSVAAWDQELVLQRIVLQENVYMDPAAQEADFSDACWALVTGWVPLEQFKRDYPKAKRPITGEWGQWESDQQSAPGWVRNDGNGKSVLVAEYWYRHVTREEITDPSDPERKRDREKVVVYCYTINGFEVLERLKWDGRYLPFVPVIGEELQPVDGERIWQGMIRPARDGQMVYNYAMSAAVEDISRLSKAPYVGAVGQFETDKPKWDSLNVRNYPYVEYDPVGVDGKPAPPPQPFPIDGTKLQLSLAMAEQAKGMVQAATAVFEPSLGEMPSKREAQSGRAILALQQQADAGTSQFTQNLVDITLMCEARIILDMMPHVYDRDGRITSLVTGEDETKTIMLGVPYVEDPNTGRPMPAQPDDPNAKTVDLNKGKYGVSVDIGKAYQTRMQEGEQFMTEIIGAFPQIMEFAGDLAFQFRDEPGAKEIAERFKKVISGKFPGLLDDKNAGSAEAAQAENQALKQQLSEIGQQFQGAVDYIKTEQAKQSAQVSIAQAKSQADMEIARMNNAAKVLIARINSANDLANAEAEMKEELLATGLKIQAEAEKQAVEHQHEREMTHEGMAHDVAMGAAGGRTAKMSRTNGQDEEREESREQSDSGSTERSEEDQPQPEGGA